MKRTYTYCICIYVNAARRDVKYVVSVRHISIFFFNLDISHLLDTLFYEVTNLADYEQKCSKSTEKLTVDSIAL